jgi:Glu-tRNA(Gln) amidotransferase subunit E-like FAD-binding protein
MPTAQQILRAIRIANNVGYDRMSHIYRMIIHIQNVEQHTYRPNPEVGEAANRDLRIKYMRNQINKEKFKVLLQQREKARLKKEEIYNVLQTVVMASTDIFQRAIRNAGRASLAYTEVEEVFKDFQELRVFVNEGMSKISKTYSCMTPHILENWNLKNMKS